jgi:hypothetical protein
MTKFNYINANLCRIKYEYTIGMIPVTILSHYSIYSRYDYYRKLNNYIGISVQNVAEEFKISNILVRKIIKEMETEC